MGNIVEVESLPYCDFCEQVAAYDAVTTLGPWANMCETHWKEYGVQLGTGWGQKLILSP